MKLVVEALYPYSAAENNQISLIPKEKIEVLEKDNSGWWIGQNVSGKVGIFPSTYVREVPQGGSGGQAKTKPPPIDDEELFDEEIGSKAGIFPSYGRELHSGQNKSTPPPLDDDEFFDEEVTTARAEVQELHQKLQSALKDREETVTRCQLLHSSEQDSRERKETTETQMHVLRRTSIQLQEQNRRLRLEVEDLEDVLQQEEKPVPEVEYDNTADEAIDQLVSERTGKLKTELERLRQLQSEKARQIDELKKQSSAMVTQELQASSPRHSKSSPNKFKNTEKDDLPTLKTKYNDMKKKYQKLDKAFKEKKERKEKQEAEEVAKKAIQKKERKEKQEAEEVAKKAIQKENSEKKELEAAAITENLRNKFDALKSQLDEQEKTVAAKSQEVEEQVNAWKSKEKKYKTSIKQYRQKEEDQKKANSEKLEEYEQRLQVVQKDRDEVLRKQSAEEDTIKKLQDDLAMAETRIDEELANRQTKSDELMMKYKKEERIRRKLYNELQELKGNIRVLCRLKPMLDENELKSYKAVDSIDDDLAVEVKDNQQNKHAKFEFDKCFGPAASQSEVYQEVQPLAMSVLDGYNVCIFAYGQTGSGKTFTMEGAPTEELRGVNYRCVNELYKIRQQRADEYRTEFFISVLEIYNDKLHDLLNKRAPLTPSGMDKNTVKIPGLTKKPCYSVEEVMTTLAQGYETRKTAATDMNKHSSRSHCILTVHTETLNMTTNVTLTGKLNLIDLAGSERLKSTNAAGDRLKEAQFINTSLTVLKRVISGLGAKEKHIPYRECMLTKLLQDSLGGNCKCMMFANISMVASNVSETISTLKFANESRAVELGKAEVNKQG